MRKGSSLSSTRPGIKRQDSRIAGLLEQTAETGCFFVHRKAGPLLIQKTGSIFFCRPALGLFVLFHQAGSGIPCLADFCSGHIVTALELVKDEGVDLGRVHFAVF